MAFNTASCALGGSGSSIFGAQPSPGKRADGFCPASVQLWACSRRQPSNATCLAVSVALFPHSAFLSPCGRRRGCEFFTTRALATLGNADEGPIELPPREIEIDPFAVPEASPAQIVASVALTGAIVFLSYRALRRRAARSKEVTFRSSGISTAKSIKEEARKTVIDNLTKAPEIRTPPPTPAQTFFGAVVAGGIALVLYKFTAGVESGFSVKAVSQDYSIRNLTITVRTIITGLCYLATFVFAANSIGLTLYAFQLLLGIGVPDPPAPPSDSAQEEPSNAESGKED